MFASCALHSGPLFDHYIDIVGLRSLRVHSAAITWTTPASRRSSRCDCLAQNPLVQTTVLLQQSLIPALLSIKMSLSSAGASAMRGLWRLQGLATFQGGVLMVSHDQHLIQSTVDELWHVSDSTVTPFHGTFNE